MASMGSITRWINQLKGGDGAAATPLWQRYGRRLIGLARARLQKCPRRAADEEDVALSAFDSFCHGVVQGCFPRLSDRDALWPLLVRITIYKAIDLILHEGRRKPRHGAVHGEESAFPQHASSREAGGFDQIEGAELPAEVAAEMHEECRRLLKMLTSEEQKIAQRKVEGCTHAEIAAELRCAVCTVERKVALIRKRWREARTI
jgi:DNA-directed RNA polymerase specialized sigma24 family protein